MDLSIQKLGKSYYHRSIFSDLTYFIPGGSRIAITGTNGSGKSTLLKIISGGALASSGQIQYELNGKIISSEHLYRYVHFAAPYNSLIEELTLEEIFRMHQQLGLLSAFKNYNVWHEKLQYKFQPGQQVRMYSSGMKQRVKLGLVLTDDRPLILLDEPTSNLDAQGKVWFGKMINDLPKSHTLIIASNDQDEINYCSERIDLNMISNSIG